MNTPVSFPIAKLLKEKQWQIPTLCYYFEDGELIQNTYKDTTGMDYGSEFQVEFSELTENWNNGWLSKKNGNRCFGCSKSNGYFETFSAPTIAEVVMWLYKTRKIWLSVTGNDDYKFKFEIYTWMWHEPEKSFRLGLTVLGETFWDTASKDYASPTEAYEAAIEYCLTNYF